MGVFNSKYSLELKSTLDIFDKSLSHSVLSLDQLVHLVLEEVSQSDLGIANLLDLMHVLLVHVVELLVVLHDAFLQGVKLLIQQLSIASLWVLRISENDAAISRKASRVERWEKHVCLVVHLSLKLEADLLLKSSDSLVGTGDLCNVEVGHDDEHEESWKTPHDPDHYDVYLQEEVAFGITTFPNWIDFVAWHGKLTQSCSVNLKEHQRVSIENGYIRNLTIDITLEYNEAHGEEVQEK